MNGVDTGKVSGIGGIGLCSTKPQYLELEPYF
jgi:hypothetical protein